MCKNGLKKRPRVHKLQASASISWCILFGVNRLDLQQLSRLRVRDAKALLNAGNFAGAYYMAGYSMECAIKAAIAKQTQRHDFPNRQLAQDSWTHDLKKLLQIASLWPKFELAMKENSNLELNWAIAKEWRESSRYMLSTSQNQAADLYSAFTARTHGILSWLKTYW